jgi:hypothetical protein
LDDADFERFRRSDLVGTCWWCGQPADSREHKYKKRDLARIAAGGEELSWGAPDGGVRSIRSIRKSEGTRFKRTLCRRCNDTRSQQFDSGYDVFSDYLVANMHNLWDRRSLDMREIFGANWQEAQLATGRYYAKHFGSLMVDNGIAPPAGLVTFLDGASYPEDCGLFLVKDHRLHFGYQVMVQDGFDGIGYWISPGVFYTNASRDRLTGYSVATRIGYVGVLFEWHEGSGRQDSFLGYRWSVLNDWAEISADDRRELEQLLRPSR